MSTEKISHNVYFEGKVQSLGLSTEKGKATVGVMNAGTYVFGTSTHETMEVVAGVLKAKLNNADWVSYNKGESFEVAANTSFEVQCDTDVAYICYYK